MYVCMCGVYVRERERKREIYEKESALTIMEAENIPRYAVN